MKLSNEHRKAIKDLLSQNADYCKVRDIFNEIDDDPCLGNDFLQIALYNVYMRYAEVHFEYGYSLGLKDGKSQ